MEALMQASSATYFPPNTSKWIRNEKLLKTPVTYLISGNGCSSPLSFSTQKLSIKLKDRKSVIAEAQKKKKKVDSHSFVSKPDEATGPFPEAVLLKEKNVQEDGRLLPEFADAEEEELFEFLNLQLESDLNVDRMRHYEVVYLIHEDSVEDVGSINSKVEGFIREKKGKIWRLSDWGLRRLACKIKKAKSAHYILMNFELEAQWINDFKSMLDKDERIIRHLVMKRDEAITEDCPPPPEFHTLHANSTDDDDDDMDFDDEGNGEDWNDNEDDIIVVVDNEEDEGKHRNDGPAQVSTRGKVSLRVRK